MRVDAYIKPLPSSNYINSHYQNPTSGKALIIFFAAALDQGLLELWRNHFILISIILQLSVMVA